jgi:hypothetical protein
MGKIALSQITLTLLFHVLLDKKMKSVISAPRMLDLMESGDSTIMIIIDRFGRYGILSIHYIH